MEVETKTIINPTDSLTDGVISTIAYEKEPEAATGDLEVEMAKEPAKLPTIVTNLDICFMLDCTGSMQSYIDRSRNKIKDIIEEVKQQYPESEIQVGIVGYRDVQDLKRFEILPFTSNIQTARNFLDAIRADGGGDTPEDVNGAFQETLDKMEWQGQAKMIVHIADAPCHGKDYHTCWSDNHPSGYKDDVAWEVLFKKIVDQRIDYLFLKIQSDTDKMFDKFKEIVEGLGASANGVLFKQEPISNADATTAAPVVTSTMTTSLFPSAPVLLEKKKRAPRKEAIKKEKKETTKTKKTRESKSKSRKDSVSRSRSKSTKSTKKEKASRKKVEKEEEVAGDWTAPTHWTRSKYQEYLEQGGKGQKKNGYWTLPQTDATEIRTTRSRSSKKSSTRKPSVSKERSEKRGKKRTEKSTKRKTSASKDKERSEERSKKASTRSKSKKGGMAVEDTLPKRAFVAPKSKILTKAPVPVMPTSFVGMSAMDEQEYFAKLLSKEMMESIHRKKDAVK